MGGWQTLEQRRTYARKRKRENRRKFLAGKSCVRCGSTERLEVDHIDPSTKVTHTFWDYSEKKRAEELKKCQVLCRSCHLKKSATDRGHIAGGRCGSRYKYEVLKCRCDLCRECKKAVRSWSKGRITTKQYRAICKDLKRRGLENHASKNRGRGG